MVTIANKPRAAFIATTVALVAATGAVFGAQYKTRVQVKEVRAVSLYFGQKDHPHCFSLITFCLHYYVSLLKIFIENCDKTG